MSANSFGQFFKMTSFGESHGPGLGVLIEGCPAGLEFDLELLMHELKRRKPGQSSVTTARQEADMPEILSGIYDNKTLGTPICILVRNTDQRSQDYAGIKQEPRTGHADDTWKIKFGHVDHRGGGRASGRETVSRVMAGAVAQMFCKKIVPDLKLKAFAEQIGPFRLERDEVENIWKTDIERFKTRFPSVKNEPHVVSLLEQAVKDGESYGGLVGLQVQGLPAGLGQPVFHKLKSDLGAAMLSLGAVTGFEFGEGFAAAAQSGQSFHTNFNSSVYGGIRGGLSTGEPVSLRVAFKPTSSIKDVAKKGRHDPCIVTRAVPVVEAMAWIVLADHLLWSRTDRI